MENILLYLLGVLIILVGLALSIALHEIGHLVPAKLFRVKVTQYMVGFGKTLWSRRRGETEYGVKLIPFGGYVAMIGMYPPRGEETQATESTTGFFQEVTQEARQSSQETVTAGDEKRVFYALAVWKKIIIMLGGPAMNLVLALLFYAVLISGFGVPQSTTTVGAVSECLVPANSEADSCTAELPQAPAAQAGMQPGDQVIAIDGTRIDAWASVREIVAANPETELSIEVLRDGTPHTLHLTPAVNERAKTDERGNVITNADGTVRVEEVGMMGVIPTTERVPQPLSSVPGYVGDNVGAVVNVIVHLPERLIDIWNAAFSGADRDANGPISVVGVGRIAGELVSHDSTPVVDKIQSMVGLLASLNVALFVFNLIPLTPLDGGHIAGALYEGIKRRVWRLLGKGDPGPVDTAKMVPVTLTVAVLLIGMSALLIYADLVKPVTLG